MVDQNIIFYLCINFLSVRIIIELELMEEEMVVCFSILNVRFFKLLEKGHINCSNTIRDESRQSNFQTSYRILNARYCGHLKIKIMKIKTNLYLLILTIIVAGCSSNNQSSESTEGLPVIDLRKNYPEKEIILTDIAKVTYVHLSTEKDEYLYTGTIDYVSENTIVVGDGSSGSILFFTKDGAPKSRFNHYGAGPQEYSTGGWSFYKSVLDILYDEKEDEVYLFCGSFFNQIIQVYSSSGKYLRTVNCPPILEYFYTCRFDIFDNQSFIMNSVDSFFLFSKATGEVLENVKIPNSEVNSITSVNAFLPDGKPWSMAPRGWRMAKSTDGFNLFLPGIDTVYYFDKNKKLTPVLCTTPLARDLEPRIFLDNFLNAGNYQFMRIYTMHYSNYRENYPERPYPDRHYVRDKKTGEVFRQKIVLPDYKGKEFFISAYPLTVFQENIMHFELDLMELKDAYRENRLSGKLKELVATLNEDEDNNVFMFVEFK